MAQTYDRSLPAYLQNTEPLEPDQLPLQVALLTMELAELRRAHMRLAMALAQAAEATELPSLGVEYDDRSAVE